MSTTSTQIATVERAGAPARGMRAIAAAVIALLLVACSGEPTQRDVTSEEADRLSEMLFHLWDEGGMSFTLDAQPSPGQQTHVEGEFDYTTGVGYALVTATGADAPVTAVIFNDTVVLEQIPALNEVAATVGFDGIEWASRPLDSTTYDLDGLLMLVAGMGTQQRDNPELLQQNGVQWLRSDELRGVKVDVFQYSPQAIFWVESGTSNLMRLEGNNGAMTRPIVVDVLSLGVPDEPSIDESTVVDSDALGELYDAYRTAQLD